jgi:cytochrome P450
VSRIKVSVMTMYAVSRYEDCAAILKDPRLVRNRSTATGGSRLPFPVPKSVRPMIESMILVDDPEHKRLRELVRQAFKPQSIAQVSERIEQYSDELLDGLEGTGEFDLKTQFAQPLPTRMIADMLGVDADSMAEFSNMFDTLTKGFGGMRMLKTMFFDLPGAVEAGRKLIRVKREQPADDILTGLIEAEHEGDCLTEDELVAMVFLLIVAGFETTMHLITNGMLALFENPNALAQLREEPALIDTAVEEMIRHRGPIGGTKPQYATQAIELHGVTIPRGKAVMPLFVAANHDPRVFDDPHTFNIARTPNHHLGFGHGIHYCLGAHLARAETRIAINGLLQRFPDLELAVDPGQLKTETLPLWNRHTSLPVRTRRLRKAA